MIALPPTIPFNPLTMARLSQQPHPPSQHPLLQRELKIDISYKFKDKTVTFEHVRPG